MSDEPTEMLGDVVGVPGPPFTDAEIEASVPLIRWREPLLIAVPSLGLSGLACRLCVARHGLKAADVGELPQTREEFEAHMASEHS